MFKCRYIICALLFIGLIGGCATAPRQNDLETQGLRNQLSVLEAQLKTKDEEINSLRNALSKTREEKEDFTKSVSKKKVVLEVKSRPNIKQIQLALKNAGYNPGIIDGRMGRLTRDAIKAFQMANNLAVDGKVGKQTWNLLSKYLYQKVK